jgi:penicillin-binding protein 2
VRRTSLSAKVDSVADTQAALSVHLATAYFGEIEYTTTLTLLRDGDRWLVSWQASAIHPDLVNGQVFKGTVEKPKRGTIFDRAKKPLAITRDVRMLGLNRGAVKDRAAVSTALVTLGATQEQIDAAFNNTGGPNQRIAVAPLAEAKTEAALAAASTLPGLLVYFDTQRVHPLGAAAAHVVGYTRELTRDELKTAGAGFAVGDRTGATGLEAAYDRQLAGRTGLDLRLMDSSGTTVRTLVTRAFVEGQDVATTLDAPTLETANARLAGRAGAAVVLDPRTNALLALNSSPSFDPDAFERNDAAALQAITKAAGKPQTNRATQGLYSAGSTFKLITGAAGLASGFFGPNDRLACGATWAGVDPPRKNWEGAQGPLTIAEGLMRSCNPVFYEIALTLYNRTDGALSKMARAFGFGAPTGIDVLAEEKGLVPDAQWKRSTRNEQWFPGDEVNLGIGQGDLLVTPLQLVNAYSAIIAGQLRTPVVTAGQAAVNRGALPLTVDQVAYLRGGLKLVTGPNGTANSVFWNAGYTDFAGKSGTAEDVGTQQHVLFVAYSPAAAPRAVAAVVLDEGQAGSIEAGPIARDIVLAAIR